MSKDTPRGAATCVNRISREADNGTSNGGSEMRAEIVIGGRMCDRRFGPLSLIDRLFGCDFFLSYGHSDGHNYVLALKRGTEATGLRVCVDLSEFSVGDLIGAIIQRRLKMSRRPMLICRPAAVRSQLAQLECGGP